MRAAQKRTRAIPSGHLSTVVYWGFGALVVAAPQLLGGAPEWAAFGTAIVAISLFLLAQLERSASSPRRLGWPPLLYWAIAALTGLQLVPLPIDWLSSLSPEVAALHIQTAEALGDPRPAFAPISGAPIEGLRLFVVALGLAAAATTAYWLGRRDRSYLRVVTALAIGGVALVGLLHMLTDASSLWGIYQPVDARPPFLSPLLNQNHFSALMVLGVPLYLGLGLDARAAQVKYIAWGAAAICSALTILSSSRGGAAALVLAVGAFGLRPFGRALGPLRVSQWASGVVALGAVGLVGMVGLKPLVEKLLDGDVTSKPRVIALALIEAVNGPFFGRGRGAFSSMFAPTFGGDTRFDYPENLIAQWCYDFGPLFGLSLVAALGLCLLHLLRRARSASAWGAAVGLMALALHDLVDFSLEMPAIALVFGALLANEWSPRRQTRLVPSRPLAIASAIVLAIAVGLSIAGFGRGLTTLRAQAATPRTAPEPMMTAMRDHPAEPIFPLAAAASAPMSLRARLVKQGLALAPQWAEPHISAASLLIELGKPEQAGVELAFAHARAPGRSAQQACRWLHQGRLAPTALIPQVATSSRAQFIGDVADCAFRSRESQHTLDLWLANQAGYPPSLTRLADRATREGKVTSALPLAEQAYRAAQTPQTARAYADALARSGRTREAQSIVDSALEISPRDRQLMIFAARLSAQGGNAVRAEHLLDRLVAESVEHPSQLAQAYAISADVMSRLGRPSAALKAYRKAYRTHPTVGLLQSIRRTARDLGDGVQVRWAEQELARHQTRQNSSAPRL